MRIGIIGCGAIARREHIPAFNALDDAQVVATASRSRASAEAAAEEAGGAKVFDDWRELVASPDVDAVVICSPNVPHAEQAIAAAEHGKHVLVEKPIAATVADADAMIAACDAAGVVLHVAHNLRYVGPVLAARDAVTKVGEIVAVRAAFGHAGPKSWAPEAEWFFDVERSGGGALIDLGVHIIDVVLFVTGLGVEQVTAMTHGDGEVEAAAQLVARLHGGALATIAASWITQPRELGLTVFGSAGTLHFDLRTPLIFRPAEGKKEEIAPPEVASTLQGDFLRATGGAAPLGAPATGPDGRAALALIEASYTAARSGVATEVTR